jgi:tellurite resistance protein
LETAPLGLWLLIVLLFAFVVFALSPRLRFGRMRRGVAQRILRVMAHVAQCDGPAAPQDIALILDTARRLTGQRLRGSDVLRLMRQLDPEMTEADYLALGLGLRDQDKEVMLQAALTIAMSSGRIYPGAYHFVIALAQGLGIPGADFRRIMQKTIAEMNQRGS